ncbi:MAG TPA: glycosyltransferase [Gammaproteobacteria bacterium]|nr:glycosyltransferase [Gammaproteobacteria bacterium]
MKKNILIFGHSYVDGFIAANNQYTKIFDPAKYEVTVVYLAGEPSEDIRKKHLTDQVIFLNSPKNSTRGLKFYALRKMLQLQREKQFQVVICHRYKPSFVMLLLSKICRIPALFFVMSDMKTFRSIRRKLAFALLAGKNITLAGVSNAVRDDIRKDAWRIPKERIITLYNMMDVESTEPQIYARDEARKTLNIAPNDFTFGILARLAEVKDHRNLIKGFTLAKPYCPNAKLIIMGDGVLKDAIQQQIQELHLQNDIILTGYLEDAPYLLKALDVFVLTSTREAFGRVLLESMISKVPIIATKTNGIPEVLGDTGYLIDAKNPEQLAAKMIMFYQMSKEKLSEEGQKAYQRLIDEFSIIPSFQKTFFNLPLLRQHHI